jgi:type I restriction enzyme R subunit
VNLTKGRIMVRGRVAVRDKNKRADYVLYFKPNLPVAVIEAKDNNQLFTVLWLFSLASGSI